MLTVCNRAVLPIAILAILMVAVMTGCEEEVGNGELSQGVTEDEILVGSVGPQSGPFAFMGSPYYAGMESYFKTINEEGGVDGREINLKVQDDEFEPDNAISGMETLIYEEEVFAIVGQLGTPGILATMDMVREEGIPSVYFGGGASEFREAGENFFPVQPIYDYEGKLMAEYAIDEFDADELVVIYANDDVGQDGLQGIKTGLEEMGREDALDADREISFNPGDTDFSSQIQLARDQDPDMVLLYALSDDAANILGDFEDASYEVPIMTTYSNTDDSFLEMAAPQAPQVMTELYSLGWLEMDEQALQPLNDAMEEYYPDEPINAYTMAGWVAAETFVAGLEEAGDDLTWDGYIDAMNQLHFTEGLAPEISYEPGVREGVTHMSVSEVVEENGEYRFEQVTDFREFGE
ncbi:ABC transporter substrate-binding protein [Natranaerobius thermophilus]|uniref:Extracellular ligand-binding receptor n=1 Tax=Natranaerobius thermophilus (strain ATCC BAA-1301 / DSM 18059 / JW/NM-WN-LF) TaxID=457570 RepID=B2A2R7_NATTJ|nr:ABC transporter substrate-binding protein [Natranaerobius thermophilus]ACB86285.1 Extracellular ligand-binding receptor [Natranaerobius thermophilus JW/NM-WN-LF]